jgi:hypothetical protein
MPPKVIRVDTKTSRYRFDQLRHGDALQVSSVAGAMEMFRRWKKTKGRRGRLIPSRDAFNTLFFIEDDIV